MTVRWFRGTRDRRVVGDVTAIVETGQSHSRTAAMRLPAALLSFAVSLAHASPAPSLHEGPPDQSGGLSAFWYKLIVSIGLVLLGGVFAGSVHPTVRIVSCLTLYV